MKTVAVMMLSSWLLAGCMGAGSGLPHEDSKAGAPADGAPALCQDGTPAPCTPRG